MDQYSTKNTDRKHLQAIMDYLDLKDISYSFDGPGETIEFDITELGRKQQEIVSKLLRPIKESKLSKWINKVINEEFSKNISKLKESSESEIDDIAVDLIDYMGKQLPPQGWAKDKRIIGFFREQGLTDPKMVQQIYNRALQMNRE